MDEMINESLAGFDSVWQRVTGKNDCEAENCPAAGTYSEEDTLLGLIHDETCAAFQSTALARMFQGDGRATLMRHANQAKRHLRRLRAEYFIATGITGGSNEDCRAVNGKLASLRSLFLQAGELAERYEKAADQTESEALREVFLTFAADERHRAQEIRALLIESF